MNAASVVLLIIFGSVLMYLAMDFVGRRWGRKRAASVWLWSIAVSLLACVAIGFGIF